MGVLAKKLSCLADFGCYGGGGIGGLDESVKKNCDENLFSENVEWVSKKL